MKRATLCLVVRGKEVLLGFQQAFNGEFVWNGYGGKKREGETFRQTAIRELKEESGLKAKEEDLVYVGSARFFFTWNSSFDHHVEIFLLKKWQGEPIPTEEMGEHRWFSVDSLPEQMWPADKSFIPLLLQGERLRIRVIFNGNGTEPVFIYIHPLEVPAGCEI